MNVCVWGGCGWVFGVKIRAHFPSCSSPSEPGHQAWLDSCFRTVEVKRTGSYLILVREGP